MFSAPEWTVLCQRTGIVPPQGFEADDDLDETTKQGAATTLLNRGVYVAADEIDDAIHPSVLANLKVLAEPQLVVRIELSIHNRGMLAVFAVQGPLGSSLVTLAARAVELSMFPSILLSQEVVRIVPATPWQTPIHVKVQDAFAHGAEPPPLTGHLPLAVFAECGVAAGLDSSRVASDVALSDRQAALAAEVLARTIGALQCLVIGPAESGSQTMLIGQVMWLATDSGWVGLRSRADGSAQQLVDLVTVTHDDIARWLAPYVARILEAAADD
jgi:hypothetical protein